MLTRFGNQPVVPTKQPPLARVMKANYGLLLQAITFLALSAGGFYFFEKESWPDLTYGDSLWWSMVTAMTVGYGDLYPKTWQGRWLVAAPTILLGVGFLAHTFGVMQKEGRLQYVWRQITT